MLSPGPEATQLATYLGWSMHGTRGGLAAGILFIVPGALVMFALSALYAMYARNMSLVSAAFFGIKCAVLAIVVEALVRIARRALKSRLHHVVALAAFIALFAFDVPFPWVVLVAGCVGFARSSSIARIAPVHEHSPEHEHDPANAPAPAPVNVSVRRTAQTLAIGLTLWFAPLAALALWLTPSHVLVHLSLFFSKLAVVTFGGAYAVLAYVAQAAVHDYAWLTTAEMVDGLGLAETTPEPLILVLQFVGFLAAFRHGAPLDPWAAATLGSLLTLWVTFVPCFTWIFAGAPYVERLRALPRLTNALACITAAVTGVILNLTVWFALHVLFARVDTFEAGVVQIVSPEWSTIRWAAVAIAALAAWLLLAKKRSLFEVLALAAALGVAAAFS